MSDQDQNKAPENEDDELESLSDEEKAAFERIMAEIAAATGASSNEPENKESKEKPAQEDAPLTQASSSQDVIPPSAEAPTEKDTVSIEINTALPTEETVSDNSPKTPMADESQAETGGADEPTEDQQAALNQIMAEIESQRREGSEIEGDPAPQAGTTDEDLSDDQQAALNAIMAEIDSKRKGESEEKGKETPTPKSDEDEELNEDQQAALNAIMAEIDSKRKGEPEEKEKKTPTPKSDEDEELNEDQQAALNAIMAEIDSKRKLETDSEKPAEVPKAVEESQTPDADPDQEAALQNILSEISAKKARSVEKKMVAGPDVDELTGQLNTDNPETEESQKESAPLKKENLSLEEFDDELAHLLTAPKEGDNADTIDTIEKQNRAANRTQEPAPAEAQQPATSPKDFPILKEVQPDEPSKPTVPPKTESYGDSKPRLRKLLYGLSLAAGLAIIGTAGIWAFHYYLPGKTASWVAPPQNEQIPSTTDSSTAMEPAPPSVEPEHPPSAETEPVEAPIVSAKRAELESPAVILSGLKNDLVSARKQIQSKIFDIQQLKSYYDRGVNEEIEKIEAQLDNGTIPSFEKAISDKSIELDLRAIQRRETYISKLDTPLGQLTAMAEALLYLERRSQTLEILNSGINGLPIETFKDEVTSTIASYLQYKTQLSIDQVEGRSLPLSAIWDHVVSDLNKKSSLLAQREPLNRAISAEICNGKYERKYQLTAISAETAQCLIKWNGKDLYLNGLTELPPDVADVLSHWQGEWLSLNGVQELSPEAAKYLAQWPGRRLSLNGLSALSPEATILLSKWKGEQLEMVGLKSIGRWENYGTRLFLSEKLRRQLEAQLE